jgi:hypothetical protein
MFVLAAVLGRARQQNAEFTGQAGLVLVGVSVMGSATALFGTSCPGRAAHTGEQERGVR